MSPNERLTQISKQLDDGIVPSKETVRAFIFWFYAYRRGYNVVRLIRRNLKYHNLRTVPDFELAYIDGQIAFERAESSDAEEELRDPTYRISSLESANRKPLSVKPQSSLSEVTTLMMTYDYSQIPVMTDERTIKGVVSWKSIGSSLALNAGGSDAQDFM
ncbi:MAG: CBS domain-containing protein [Candidatus Hydrogenedentota bacterium]